MFSIGVLIGLTLVLLFSAVPFVLNQGLGEWKEFVCGLRGGAYLKWNGFPYCFFKDEIYKESDSFEGEVVPLTS